jgi:signal transduction histidine kinase
MSKRVRRFRDVPLLWKILVPFLVLMLAVGLVGSFAIVRSLSSRAQASIDQELTRQMADARSALHDDELSLLESVGFAANLQGMAEAIVARDEAAVDGLLRSVQALKPDLDVLVVTDKSGQAFGDAGAKWVSRDFVRRALNTSGGATAPGFGAVGTTRMMFVASSVCGSTPCIPVGSAVVGFEVRKLASDLGSVLGEPNGVAIYDAKGHRLATAGDATSRSEVPASVRADRPVRTHERTSGTDTNTLFATFQLDRRPSGFVAVSVPSDPFFASVRATAWRLALLLLVTMAGIVAIGTFLARAILAQLRTLVQTNRALGRGDLTARAPVTSSDELGELATGLNDMADQLEASYETLELRVKQRTDEVRRLLKERTQLFASVSHEFRTPLAVILGQVNLLRDPTFRRGKSAKALATIDESTRQLLVLIDDILAAAKTEGGAFDVDLESVRLPDVLSDVRHTLDGLVRSGEHRLRVDVPKDLPAVRADPDRLREIVLNLVENSVKYTPAGGSVEISAIAKNGHVEVSVRDNGVGIPRTVGDTLFQPFQRVRGTTTQGGQTSTGLGLALTKRLVEAHGGEIWFESKKGAGTTFTFTLTPAP